MCLTQLVCACWESIYCNNLKHSVTNMKFWYERISEYIRIEKNNTNECPNIFVSKKGYEYDTNEYSWRKIFEYIRISEYSTLYDMKNMIRTNIRIYSDQKNDTNEYTNIFVSKKGYKYDTNEYLWQKIFKYIQISEYSSHNDSYYEFHGAIRYDTVSDVESRVPWRYDFQSGLKEF